MADPVDKFREPMMPDVGRLPYARESAHRTIPAGAAWVIGFLGLLAFWAAVAGVSRWLSPPRVLCSTTPADRCKTTLSAAYLGLLMYHDDHAMFPPTLNALYPNHAPEPIRCGCTTAAGPDGTNYCYIAGLDPNDPTDWFLAFDHPQNHADGTVHVLFADGHNEWLSAQRFRSRLEKFLFSYRRTRGGEPKIIQPY